MGVALVWMFLKNFQREKPEEGERDNGQRRMTLNNSTSPWSNKAAHNSSFKTPYSGSWKFARLHGGIHRMQPASEYVLRTEKSKEAWKELQGYCPGRRLRGGRIPRRKACVLRNNLWFVSRKTQLGRCDNNADELQHRIQPLDKWMKIR